MHSASLKRGKLTARLGRLETLPGGPDSLKKEITQKEEVLAKLCHQYEGLVKAQDDKKKAVEASKKNLQLLESKTGELEQTRRRLEAITEASPPPSPTPIRQKREAIQQESRDLHQKVEKTHRKLGNLQKRKQKEEEEGGRRKEQKSQWEKEERQMTEAIQKDGKEAQELEAFIARLSEALFERQRKYEEMLIGAGGGDVGGFDGMERKIREERRRLLKERQLLEEKWPREEEDEEEGQSHKTLNSDNGKSLEEVAEKWIKTMDELLVSDAKLSEQEAIAHALSTRINQIEAALRLLQMKKDPTIYTAYTHKEEPGSRAKKEPTSGDLGVKIPDFRRKIKEFIHREQAGQRAFLADPSQDVDGAYWDNLEEVQKENSRRKQMVQQGEEWARQKLTEELNEKMRTVENWQHEVDTAESRGNKMKKEIQRKRQEIQNEERKKEAAERRRQQRKMEAETARRKADSLRRKKVENHQTRIQELRHRRQEAEAKRKQIRAATTVADREATDVRVLVHGLQARLHDDTPELQKTAESYRTRIGELQGLEEDLRKMLAEAKRVNQVSKEQLAVVKPYQAEQHDMDNLLEEERQLDRQLKEAHKQMEAGAAFPDDSV